ncbi:MAG TPA: DUF899 family protein [Caulobacteraceae bacterium]|jgi:predicted dithiol-disulfide oxidoreductase (DUF899 family)|nr:DUF899 family protein [Caulobacteraceae bacterium]
MTYADSMTAIAAKRAEMAALGDELKALQAKVEPEAVEDFVLAGWDGPVRLSQLFGDKRDLIVIHNMGTGCPACTMWADGFNGVYDHLASRAAFVVASPNPVATQKQFAKSRGWRFPMVSCEGSQFAEVMRYRHRDDCEEDEADGGWNPGVSIFRREGDQILRVSDAEFGDGDGFCVVFSLFDMLPPDAAWRPKYKYD